ncbi:MAG: TraB/GumN family protein [Deltaproteobacteria bacterium]|jgi:pheromone shutdown-related protein TraB
MTEEGNIHRLTYRDKDVVLIGTAHLSRASTELVKQVIEQERPDTVCVELCRSRYESMTQRTAWQEKDLIKVIKEKKAFLLLSNLMLASFQKRIGRKLGIKPGQEILQALEAAEAVGAEIHLADREIRITLSRTWRLMGLWTKAKLFAEFLSSVGDLEEIKEEDIEKLKERDVLEALLAEIEESLPEVRRVLIDERDRYLAYKIRTAPGKNIVAVVGAGHVPGVLHYWDKQVDMESLERMPPKGRLLSFMKWVLPALICGLIILGFFAAGKVAAAHMIKWWLVANASLAGLGAGLALGHPLTVLSAVLASPLTSLNPMIAAGWVAGVVEALLGKPKVKDFENLPEDIASLKGFWRNKITRILMVVVFTNMGSAVGTFVAIPLMLKVLA